MAHIMQSCQVGRAQKCGIMKQADIQIDSLRGRISITQGEGLEERAGNIPRSLRVLGRLPSSGPPHKRASQMLLPELVEVGC